MRVDAAAVIAARHGLDEADVVEWLRSTRWSRRVGIAARDIAAPCAALAEIRVVATEIDPSACLTQ
jgi:hypothetical protein